MYTNTTQIPGIKLTPPFSNCFYTFLKEEYILVNGKEDREEEKAIIHLDIHPQNNPQYHELHIETFRKNYRSATLSDSDKDLKKQLSYPLQDIRLIVNPNGIITQIRNLKQIQEKQEKKKEKLKKNLTGKTAERFFSSVQAIYESEKRLGKILEQYDYLGLLLFPFYREESRKIRSISLMKNTLVHIEEEVINRTVIQETGEIEVQVQGKMIAPVYTTMFQTVSEQMKIAFNEEDIPVLKQYDSGYILDIQTGMVKQARLLINFSFGEGYEKTLHYQLIQTAHEEI